MSSIFSYWRRSWCSNYLDRDLETASIVLYSRALPLLRAASESLVFRWCVRSRLVEVFQRYHYAAVWIIDDWWIFPAQSRHQSIIRYAKRPFQLVAGPGRSDIRGTDLSMKWCSLFLSLHPFRRFYFYLYFFFFFSLR